jgi:hypothetical protein
MRAAVQVLVGTVQSLVTLPWFLLRSRWQLARFDEPRMVPGARNDFLVHLDRVGSSLTAKCVGLASERGEPGRPARETLTPMVVEQIGGEEAFRYHLAAGRTQLTEWKFSHRGWLYVVGAFNHAEEEAATVARAREVLDTWVWLD